MKRLALILLALVLAVQLCACGAVAQNAPAEETPTTEQTAPVEQEDPSAKYVGTWVSTGVPLSGAKIHSIRLLPSGKAIWSYYSADTGTLVTEEESAYSGQWELDEDRILVYYTYSMGNGDGVYIFNVLTEKTLSRGQVTYLRQES